MTGKSSGGSSDSPLPDAAKHTQKAPHLTGQKRARETLCVFGGEMAGRVVSARGAIDCERRQGAETADEFRVARTQNTQQYQ
jgi:hypothetical protein